MYKNRINPASITIILLALLISACGGSSGGSGNGDGGDGAPQPIAPLPMLPGSEDAQYVAFYPPRNAREVPVTTQAVVRFTESVYELESVLNEIDLYEGSEGSVGDLVPTALSYADEGRTVVLTPLENLAPNSWYSVRFRQPGASSASFNHFVTGGDPDGEMEDQSTDVSAMNVVMVFPTGVGTGNPMSTAMTGETTVLRLLHSQPIDPETVRYGDNIRLVVRNTDELVDAKVAVSGRLIVIDPVEDLEHGIGYEVKYTDNNADAIHSIFGAPFNTSTAGNLRFGVELASAEGAFGLPATLAGEIDGQPRNSPWTDWFVNEVSGVNLDTLSFPISLREIPYMMFFVNTEIGLFKIENADLVASHEESIARQLGSGNGTVEVSFPTDITGYFFDDGAFLNGGAAIRLYVQMDVSLNGEPPVTVAPDMAGYIVVNEDTGEVTIDLVGAIDPAVLGQERVPGNGMISLQIGATVPDEV